MKNCAFHSSKAWAGSCYVSRWHRRASRWTRRERTAGFNLFAVSSLPWMYVGNYSISWMNSVQSRWTK